MAVVASENEWSGSCTLTSNIFESEYLLTNTAFTPAPFLPKPLKPARFIS